MTCVQNNVNCGYWVKKKKTGWKRKRFRALLPTEYLILIYYSVSVKIPVLKGGLGLKLVHWVMVHIAVFQFPIFREVEKTRCFSFTQKTWNFWKYRGKDLFIFQNIRVPKDTILSAFVENIAE